MPLLFYPDSKSFKGIELFFYFIFILHTSIFLEMPVSAAARRRLIRFTQVLVGGPVVVFGGLALWTRKCAFEPFGPETDPLFKHAVLKQLNPRSLPSSHDSCVRKVPFGQLRPELLEDARRGGSALVQEFSRGMWGGYGIYSLYN
jgi:hypothetical protein